MEAHFFDPKAFDLAFLNRFKVLCDTKYMYERAAIRVLPYYETK